MESLPPFELDGVRDLIARMGETATGGRIVLVGGQALAFWAAQVAPWDPVAADAISASVDIDFQAWPDDARRAARALGVALRVPTMDEPTAHTGLAQFIDHRGITRTLDFIEGPYGLEPDDVRDTALAVDLAADGATATFWVMHPERCLRSRVFNLDLPSKRGTLAITQLRSAVTVVRAFGTMQLDAGVDEKVVRNTNEAVFRLAVDDRRSHRALLEHGVDIMDALIDDPRLDVSHREIRLPQIRQAVAARRNRWTAK